MTDRTARRLAIVAGVVVALVLAAFLALGWYETARRCPPGSYARALGQCATVLPLSR